MSGEAAGPDSVIPGETICAPGDVEINAGAPVTTLTVVNAGDRPIQVGSHFHFPQTNAALEFDRLRAHGLRLNIPAGTAVRFEPGVEMTVELVPVAGARVVPGLSLDPPHGLD